MIKLVELILQMQHIIKKLEGDLQEDLKKRSISLSIQEVICMFEAYEKKSLEKLKTSSIHAHQHLMFNLHRLEKQELLNLHASGKVANSKTDYNILFSNKSEDIVAYLKKVRVTREQVQLVRGIVEQLRRTTA